MEISMKELKKNRLTPAERFVLKTIEGAEPVVVSLNGYVEWYNKDGKWLLGQDFIEGRLGVSYQNIQKNLEEEFGLNYDEIKELYNNLLYDYTNKGKLKI